MTKRGTTSIAASVHQRLLNLAKASGRPFNELLVYYGIERFLYRLSISRYGERFVLKGAPALPHPRDERRERPLPRIGQGGQGSQGQRELMEDRQSLGQSHRGIGTSASPLPPRIWRLY